MIKDVLDNANMEIYGVFLS